VEPDEVDLPAGELSVVFGARARDAADVSVQRLAEPVPSATRGIWRVQVGERTAVLKLIGHARGGHANWQSGDDPAHWYYWRREVLAFETGLLAGLPGGLRAPECHAIVERGDGNVALWLEDLGDTSASTWTVDRYGLAARHLGPTQGGYLGRVPLPADEWLSRNWMRTYLLQRDGDLELLDDPAVWSDPRVASWFPEPVADAAKAMRADQSVFLETLDRMPRTLCHLDLHPANLFADSGADDTTVAIDWSFVGLGAIGEDAGNLVPDAVLDFHVPPSRIDELHETVASGYAAGLRDAGWRGSIDDVRRAMASTMAAKYAWILPALLRGAAEGRELVNGRPIDETAQWWVPTVHFLLARAAEARDLR
jgi:hypothetical protein